MDTIVHVDIFSTKIFIPHSLLYVALKLCIYVLHKLLSDDLCTATNTLSNYKDNRPPWVGEHKYECFWYKVWRNINMSTVILLWSLYFLTIQMVYVLMVYIL